MDLLLVMTLSGSFFLILYLLFKFLLKSYLTENTKYLMLKFSILFFVLPSIIIKNLYSFLLSRFRTKIINYIIFISDSEKIKVHGLTDGKILYMSTYYKVVLTIGILWLLLSLLTFSWYMFRYFRNKKQMTQISDQILDPNILLILQQEKENLKIKRNIRLYFRTTFGSAFTIGVLKPTIYLPPNLDSNLISITLRHELIHIKNFDIIFKFLCILLKSIYWFNPLVYFLQKEIETVSETCCDSLAIRTMDRNTRKLYAQLIVRNATNKNLNKNLVLSALNDNAKKTKERVELIMNFEKKSVLKSFLSLTLTGFAIIGTSVTAFAYHNTIELGWNDKFIAEPGSSLLISNGVPLLDTPEYPILYDKEIITQDGSILKLKDNNYLRIRCATHDFESITIQQHIHQSSGGCIISSYSGQHCKSCTYTLLGSLIFEVKYVKCPHD